MFRWQYFWTISAFELINLAKSAVVNMFEVSICGNVIMLPSYVLTQDSATVKKAWRVKKNAPGDQLREPDSNRHNPQERTKPMHLDCICKTVDSVYAPLLSESFNKRAHHESY